MVPVSLAGARGAVTLGVESKSPCLGVGGAVVVGVLVAGAVAGLATGAEAAPFDAVAGVVGVAVGRVGSCVATGWEAAGVWVTGAAEVTGADAGGVAGAVAGVGACAMVAWTGDSVGRLVAGVDEPSAVAAVSEPMDSALATTGSASRGCDGSTLTWASAVRAGTALAGSVACVGCADTGSAEDAA